MIIEMNFIQSMYQNYTIWCDKAYFASFVVCARFCGDQLSPSHLFLKSCRVSWDSLLPATLCTISIHQGTTITPILPACATTLLHSPSKLSPLNLISDCLIFAISYTCLRLTLPTCPVLEFPGGVPVAVAFPLWPSLLLFGPGTFPAPRIRFLTVFVPAAAKRSEAVGGVRRSNVKDRSGRTIIRAGIGVPTM